MIPLGHLPLGIAHLLSQRLHLLTHPLDLLNQSLVTAHSVLVLWVADNDRRPNWYYAAQLRHNTRLGAADAAPPVSAMLYAMTAHSCGKISKSARVVRTRSLARWSFPRPGTNSFLREILEAM